MRNKYLNKILCTTGLIMLLLLGATQEAKAGSSIFYNVEGTYDNPYGLVIYIQSNSTSSWIYYTSYSASGRIYPTNSGSYVHTIEGYSSGTTAGTVASGLAPNGYYSTPFSVDSTNPYMPDWKGTVFYYTDTAAPSNPTFTNISDTQTTVSWTPGANLGTPSYTLYRGPSSSGPWTSVYTGTGTSAIVTGLSAESRYYFYLVCAGNTGVTSVGSGVTSVVTSADRTVAAAEAAKGAAEASMAASEQAKTSAQQASTGVQSLRTEFQEFINADTKDPVIGSFAYSIPKVTIISLSTVNYKLIANDNSSLQYRYKINGGAFTGWANLISDTVSINIGASTGIKEITVQVMDSGGNTDTATATIFKI